MPQTAPRNGHGHRHGHRDKLQHLAAPLEVKFKGGAFATWSDVFVRLEGRWMVLYKRERDPLRLAAIELGHGVDVTDLSDQDNADKFPRRFDVHCRGGLLPPTDFIFRTRSRKDRDLWVHAVANNIRILDSVGLELSFALQDLDPVITRMKEALNLMPIRIRSALAVRCATGEEIVAFLVNEDLARDRAHATQIGRRLLAMNVIHHVVWEKDFMDSPDHYTISELDEESNYVVEHFQKYMDARRFWKYFDDDTGSATGSGRLARSTGGSSGDGSSSMSQRASATTLSAMSAETASNGGRAVTPTPPPSMAVGDKKIKKCSVCGKSFNPLRRRYFCRQCAAVVCSHCSMSRKGGDREENGNGNGNASGSARVCVSCKLSSMNDTQDDFYDRIFTTPGGPASEQSSLSRASSFSHVSSSGASGTGGGAMDGKRMGSGSSLQQHQHHHHHHQQQQQQQQHGYGPPQPALRRKSSTPSQRSLSAQGDSFTSVGANADAMADCGLCMDEACAPLHDFYEVPYPVTQDHLEPSSREQYLAAYELENESERLRSVDVLLQALETSSAMSPIANMCSMASIATTCPMVVVGLLTRDSYVLCGQFGVDMDRAVARELSLAAHTCRHGTPLVCAHLDEDVRFAGNPWRRDTLQASFYAGIPLQLSNGHIVGAIEVFDASPRFACMEVLDQMQTIVKGVLRKFERILAMAAVDTEAAVQSGQVPVAQEAEKLELEREQEQKRVREAMAPIEVEVVDVDEEEEETEPAPATSAEEGGEGAMSENDMQNRLMQLLSQTTNTQEQLRNQQGHMFTAINSHSKKISDLAKQLERMESTLNTKLDSKDDSAAPVS